MHQAARREVNRDRTTFERAQEKYAVRALVLIFSLRDIPQMVRLVASHAQQGT